MSTNPVPFSPQTLVSPGATILPLIFPSRALTDLILRLIAALAMRSHISMPNPTCLIQSLNAVEFLRVSNFLPLDLVLSLASLILCMAMSHLPQFLSATSWIWPCLVHHSYVMFWCSAKLNVILSDGCKASFPDWSASPLASVSLSFLPEDSFENPAQANPNFSSGPL